MKGFTLLEVLVAISILTVAMLGPVAVATRALSSSSVSTNQLIAYNLAEEGMEFIINKRDSLIFTSPLTGWDDFRTFTQSNPANCQSGGGENGCDVNIVTKALFRCTSASYPNSPCMLRKDNVSGLYSYDAGDPITIFERRIFVPAGGSSPEKAVTVTVTWKEKAGNMRAFTLERVVFDRK